MNPSRDGNRNYSNSRCANLKRGRAIKSREEDRSSHVFPRERLALDALVLVVEIVRVAKKAWIPAGKNSRLVGDSIKRPHLFRSWSEMFRAITSRCVSPRRCVCVCVLIRIYRYRKEWRCYVALEFYSASSFLSDPKTLFPSLGRRNVTVSSGLVTGADS